MPKKLSDVELAELAQKILTQPSLLDRLDSPTLKAVGKTIVSVLIAVGNRAGQVEEAHGHLLKTLQAVTGNEVPSFSYVHRDEVMRLHTFTEFLLYEDKDSQVFCACGGVGDGLLHAIYEFDVSDYGRTQAERLCSTMVNHLRCSFLPRSGRTVSTQSITT